VNVWLQSRSLPARGRVGLEVHRCLCIIDAGNVFISTIFHLDVGVRAFRLCSRFCGLDSAKGT